VRCAENDVVGRSQHQIYVADAIVLCAQIVLPPHVVALAQELQESTCMSCRNRHTCFISLSLSDTHTHTFFLSLPPPFPPSSHLTLNLTPQTPLCALSLMFSLSCSPARSRVPSRALSLSPPRGRVEGQEETWTRQIYRLPALRR
jgi:hypothetical protein